MRSMRSVQCQVELRRLGNQLPVLGKANSLCKIVKKKIDCFAAATLYFGPRRGPGYPSSGKIRLALDDVQQYPL